MALPTLQKTWQFDLNRVGGAAVSQAQDYAEHLLSVKNALKGFAILPWTVSSSSDGTTADSNDNWTVWGDLVWGTSTRSWIVLKAPGSEGYEICIDLNRFFPYRLDIVWSPSGAFGAGTITARPTAADEIVLHSDWNWIAVDGYWGTTATKIQALHSEDGDATMVITYRSNYVVSLWRMEVVVDKVSGWTDGVLLRFDTSASNTASCAEFSFVADQTDNFAQEGGTLVQPYLTYEARGTTETAVLLSPGVPSEWDSNNPIMPMGLVANTVGYRGHMGHPSDFWWGVQARSDGDQYPDTGTLKQFTQIGDLIVPWDESTVLQTA